MEILKSALLVFLGAGCGGVFRWSIGHECLAIFGATAFPLGTFLANVLACVGAVFIVLAERFFVAGTDFASSPFHLLLFTGFLGGLGTMSTFSLETVELFRAGAWHIAILNIVLTIVVCLGLLALAPVPAKN